MKQIETKMIETPDSRHAVCLDPHSRFTGWVMYKHPDGQWVSLRRATPFEIMGAQAKLQGLKERGGSRSLPQGYEERPWGYTGQLFTEGQMRTALQHTWIDLTDGEIEECYKQGGIGRALKLLKEKNT